MPLQRSWAYLGASGDRRNWGSEGRTRAPLVGEGTFPKVDPLCHSSFRGAAELVTQESQHAAICCGSADLIVADQDKLNRFPFEDCPKAVNSCAIVKTLTAYREEAFVF